MPKTPSVRYYPTRSGYYTCFRSQQIPLAKGPDDKPTGPVYLAALKKFTELMETANADKVDQGNTVRLVCELYGRHLESEGRTSTLRIVRDSLKSGLERFGDLTMTEFKVIHVTEWLQAMALPRVDSKGRTGRWNETYKNMAARTLVCALNWAKKQGLISRHCLQEKGTIKTKKRSRGKGAYIESAVYDRLLSQVNANLADLLEFMRRTGCRPAEAYHVEARYYSPDDCAIVYPGEPQPGDFEWKNARRTGKDRNIFLDDKLVKMVERRIKLYPSGPIFRTTRNRRWGNEAVSTELRWYTKKLKLPKAPTAYGLRHSFATDWLLNSGSIKVLADLMGTSVAMIEKHYGHLQVDKARMRSMLVETMAGRDSRPRKKAKK